MNCEKVLWDTLPMDKVPLKIILDFAYTPLIE